MKLNVLFIVILLSFIGKVNATHVVGGDISFEYVSPGNYNINGTVFRDCAGAVGVEQNWEVGVYDMLTDNLVMQVTLTNPQFNLLSFGDECYTPENLCVEEYKYDPVLVNLPINVNGYYIQAQLYARSDVIDNISNSGSTGMSFYAELLDVTVENSNPVFGDYPMDSYFCVNLDKTFDLNVNDPDGDELRFSLVDPLNSSGTGNITQPKPYNSVTWAPGYSLGNIVGGNPPMTVNPTTGRITANAGAQGIFVFALLVEEFRGGVKIGETRRDIQFAALQCAVDTPPLHLTDGSGSRPYTNLLGDTTCFDIVAQDPDIGDSIVLAVDHSVTELLGSWLEISPDDQYIYWNGTDMDTVFAPSVVWDEDNQYYVGNTVVGVRYCWQTDCGDELNEVPYNIKASSYSLGCSGRSDSIFFDLDLEVYPLENGYQHTANVFTPNGDGHNDRWKISGIEDPCYDYIHISVYDRWGFLVFETTDPYFEWDGTNLKGEELPSGTYYVLSAGQWGAVPIKEEFHVTIFRD